MKFDLNPISQLNLEMPKSPVAPAPEKVVNE